jgi:predicted regulator of Ras-like GTPase activity (Roadblock/LC7/MglB family)
LSTETADTTDAVAADAVSDLMDDCAGLRACALLRSDGSVLAETADVAWAGAVAELWSAAAREGEPEPVQLHVATEEGEIYAVRDDDATAVAVTDRFTLASLMFCDLRSALRRVRGAR